METPKYITLRYGGKSIGKVFGKAQRFGWGDDEIFIPLSLIHNKRKEVGFAGTMDTVFEVPYWFYEKNKNKLTINK